MATTKRTVCIVGDVTVDWLFLNPGGGAEGIEFPEIWGGGFECCSVARPGGGAMLSELLEKIAATDAALAGQLRVVGPSLPPRALASPGYRGITRAWTSWGLFPRRLDESGEYVWRIVSFWGESRATGSAELQRLYPEGVATPDYLLIDDSDLGFRDAEPVWSRLLDEAGQPKAILLKMAAPLAQGPLWARLSGAFADALTVVVPVNDLRKSGAQIGNPLSWERTVQEIDTAVRTTELVKAARVVVSLGPTGAVLVDRLRGCTLVFDPRAQEGDWEKDHPGLIMGYATCMGAALLLAAVSAKRDGRPSREDLAGAVERGVLAARTLHEGGYAEVDRAGRLCGGGRGGDARRCEGLSFPYERVAAALTGSRPPRLARITLSAPHPPDRSILVETLGKGNLQEIACKAALYGPDHLPSGIPIETVGKWSSVDRSEIEGMRAVRNTMAGYINRFQRGDRMSQPLSIAVFGPPGAGKSFAVKQMARVLLPGRLQACTFNLSEFRSEEELPQAFHRVRDLALQQALPLVFWDEFDTPLADRSLGWLRFFLAPMQDGEFREAGGFHPIGPAIFVFAGGTSSTLQQFATVVDEATEKVAKKPDFLSRLKGYVNVFGPNPLGPDDVAYRLRRALLLRALIGGKAPQLFRGGCLNIDPGVLRAFIAVDRFRHGARSMEAIIDTSTLAGRLHYERSSLPPEDQLELHVDAAAFLKLVAEA